MKFTISILAWDRIELTRKCLASVLRQSIKDTEIILTNNGSTDGTDAYFNELARKHPFIRVVHNATNQGFIDPNRAALEMAQGRYFVMLNNDAEVPRGWLEKLEQPFLDYGSAALSGPEGACSAIGNDFHGHAGGFEYLEGSCLCGRTDLLKEHGLFAPYLRFAYGEDSDLSLRMRELGYSLHKVPFQIVHHRGATSTRVPGIEKLQAGNHAALKLRWAHYLKTRRMDYPIILQRMGAWGDALFTTPVLAALRREKPLSPIHVVTGCPDVFRDNPCVQGVSDRVPDLQDALHINLDMAYENMPGMHIVDAYARVAQVSRYDKMCELYGVYKSTRTLENNRPWVALHVGPTTWAGKNWPQDRFRELNTKLRGMGYDTVLVGNSRDGDFGATLDLRGQTTVHEMANVLVQCVGFIGLCSFPIHVAQSVGLPVVGIFGATLPEFILTDGSPWEAAVADPSIPCAGERHRVSGSVHVACTGQCIRSVTVRDVQSAFGALMEKV